jgi:cohesin loading factor subunit SCC2
MTLDRSATIMDAIFSSPDEESRGRLLRIMQEFLVSEAAKHSTKEKGIVAYASTASQYLILFIL